MENLQVKKQIDFKRILKDYSAFFIFLALFIFASIRYEEFLDVSFITNLVSQNTMIGLLAFGMTFVIIGGDIDLSVGSTMAICGIIAAKLCMYPVIVPITAALLTGLLIGLVNGVMVAKLKIVPFIATLSTMIGVEGIVYIVTGSKSVPTTERTQAFAMIGDKQFIQGLPNQIIIYLIIFGILFYVLKYTKYGRYNYAIGGNENAAKMMGIKVDKVRITNYLVSGTMAACGALIMTSRLGSGQYTAGKGWEMDAIAATIIGGTLMAGGAGKISGTFFGVLILGIMKQIFNLQGNLNSWWQNIATGVILLVVVIVQSRARSKNK